MFQQSYLLHRAIEKPQAKPPIWLMRQAGRYLPEYREIRAKAGDFVSLCLNPELACEVTLQPIRRFGFDASIIFSDILMIPYAMGQKLWFEEGEGPRLGPLNWHPIDPTKLEPVYDAIRLTRAQLPKETALIGFAGAPWTLLLYGVQGKGGNEFEPAKILIAADKRKALKYIDDLVFSIILHLHLQIQAGCDTIQIFDSWAGLCPPAWQKSFILTPIKRIVHALRMLHPYVPIIVFAKDFPDLDLLQKTLRSDVIGFDQNRTIYPMRCAVQGNLDPQILIEGGDRLTRAVDNILQKMDGQKHIFNLGHGIDKSTPIAHVEALIKQVRG